MGGECFIEVVRKDANGKSDGYCVARIRADFVTAIIEVETKNDTSFKKFVRLHLGNNNFVDCQNESLGSVWNKMNQAFGHALRVVGTVSPDYPGHPDYDAKHRRVAA